MSNSPIEWTERDVEAAFEVLGYAGGEKASLPTLTDEEVVALDGVERDQAVPTPWLDAQDADRATLTGVALRGLLAKELVYPVIFEGEDQPTRLHSTTEITGLLTLRRTGSQVMSVQRTVSTGLRWLFLYIHEGGALMEEIDEGGLHGFTVLQLSEVSGRMSSFVDPEDAAASDSEVLMFSEPEFEAYAMSELGDSLAASNIVVFKTDSPDVVTRTVFTGADSVTFLTPDVSQGGLTMQLRQVSAESLDNELSALFATQ